MNKVMTNSSNSTAMGGFCRKKGAACCWANQYGDCNLTGCVRFYEFILKEMGMSPKGADK